MADTMLVYVENPMKSTPAKAIRIINGFCNLILVYRNEKIQNGQNCFEKRKGNLHYQISRLTENYHKKGILVLV